MVMAVWKYDEDLTGVSPNNLVSGEVHNIPQNNQRAFATNYGPFYSDSPVVTVRDTGQVLVNGVGYQCLYLYSDATAKSGKPVTAVIHIIDASVVGDVLVDYQVVGGQYSSNAYALEDLIALLQIDNSSISWENITNRPVVFPPAPHLHAATDLFGLEWVVDALNEITQAVMLGDSASHDQIYLRIATVKQQLQDSIDFVNTTLTARINQVETDMDSMDTRLTTGLNNLAAVVTAHIGNRNNPHEVTASQAQAVPITRTVNGKALSADIVLVAGDVGAYSKTEIDTKVTTLQNADAQLQVNINNLSTAVTAHVNNRSNPHGVNAGQTQAVPLSRTINGKALYADIFISAGDTGTYDAGTINSLIANVANNARTRLGGRTGFTNGNATYFFPAGCVLTGLGDFGANDGYGAYSPVQQLINGNWVTIDGPAGGFSG